jgi:hypothetical protein
MLEGEILIREGNLEVGIAELRSVVKNEDALRYDEPPGCLIPVRHSLGASLMQAELLCRGGASVPRGSRAPAAKRLSLFGLAQSLQRQGKEEEAKRVEVLYRKILSKADVQITSSCLCQTGV